MSNQAAIKLPRTSESENLKKFVTPPLMLWQWRYRNYILMLK